MSGACCNVLVYSDQVTLLYPATLEFPVSQCMSRLFHVQILHLISPFHTFKIHVYFIRITAPYQLTLYTITPCITFLYLILVTLVNVTFHPKPPKQIEITPVRGTNHTRTRNKSHPYSKQTPMAILARYENFYNTLSSFLHKSFIERCPY